MVIALAILVFLVGASLGLVGLRGRRVSDHPHCAACGFDLIGLDLAKADACCSECGANLSPPRAIRDGARARRPRFLAAGALLLILALSLAGVAIATQVRGFNWNTIKPAWILSRELTHGGPTVASDAIKELETRLRSLSQDRVNRILEIALARQADPKAPWSAQWGNFLESCRVRGLLSDEQLRSFARNAANIAIEFRPRIAEGGNLAIRAVAGSARVGDASKFTLILRCIQTSEDGRVIDRGGAGGSFGLGLSSAGSMGSLVKMTGPLGPRTLTSKWHCSVRDGEMTGPELAGWDQEFQIPLTVDPAGTVDVELISDESLRPAVEASLTAAGAEVYPTGTGGLQASGMINAQGPPVNLAFDVYWRATDGSGEWKAGSVSFVGGAGGSGFGYGGPLPKGFNHSKVDIVLRPNVKVAAETTNIYKIWDGEVVLHGQSVSLPAPPPTPTKKAGE